MGKFIHSADEMVFCVFELKEDLSDKQHRFYEQSLINRGIAEGYDVKNKISAMKTKDYNRYYDSWAM